MARWAGRVEVCVEGDFAQYKLRQGDLARAPGTELPHLHGQPLGAPYLGRSRDWRRMTE